MRKNMRLSFGVSILSMSLILSGCTTPAWQKIEEGNKKFNQASAMATTDKTEEAKPEKAETEEDKPGDLTTYNPPSLDDVPEGPAGEAIKYGYKLHEETNTALPENVGNKLSCSSCHGNAGLDNTSPLTGVTAAYPAYNARAGKEVTIEERINGCFQRSMNGKPLATDSEEMKAMVAYLTYISQGVPAGVKERPWIAKNSMKEIPETNIQNGENLYKQSCMACHAADGSGTGPNTGPALWGDNSFNNGAGMARISTAAGYIQRNMPLGQMGGIKQGELTDQQAADLAAYILSKDRPVYKDRAKDWPKGKAPKDSPYFHELESTKAGLNN